jgi:mono/diheme cytochrome c family protein
MEEASPARLFAGVIGATLVTAGVVGFFYNSGFNSNPADHDAVFGLLDVNGWHNVVHIATGLLGLIAYTAGSYASRGYAFGIGIAYAAITIWGFIIGSGESILGVIPINTADNLLHLAIALTGLAASQMWGVAAVAATAMLFGIAIPGVVTSDNDDTNTVARGKMLFEEDGCRNCHTLADAGSLGTIGPDLNELKPNEKQVLAAIQKGGQGTGAMPARLANGADAEAIAAYVADVTGASSPIDVGGPAGKQIFVQNCGSCHTLADAQTTGTTGPNLDQLEPDTKRVLAAIKSGPGVMPENLVSGKDAQQVADYVASVAGR